MSNENYRAALLLQESLEVAQRLAPNEELLHPSVLSGLNENGYVEWGCLVRRRDQLIADVSRFAEELG
jgi:hypothetical protein